MIWLCWRRTFSRIFGAPQLECSLLSCSTSQPGTVVSLDRRQSAGFLEQTGQVWAEQSPVREDYLGYIVYPWSTEFSLTVAGAGYMLTKYFGSLVSLVFVLSASYGQAPKMTTGTLALDSLSVLELVDAKAEVVNYRGRPAVHLIPLPNQPKDYSMLATVSDTDFKDGTIEIDVAGSPRKDADPSDRGFIGLAFRSQERGARAEYASTARPRRV